MLALTVSRGGEIVIEANGKRLGVIHVREAECGRARIGIDFPRDVVIYRRELGQFRKTSPGTSPVAAVKG